MLPAHKLFMFTLSCFLGGFLGCSTQVEDAAPVVNRSEAGSVVELYGRNPQEAPEAPRLEPKIAPIPVPDAPSDKVVVKVIEDHHGATFYTVDHYDVTRDPTADLAETIQRATKEKKRILIQVGGDWCGWCRLMSKFMETDPVISKTLTDNFLVMKVTIDKDQSNEAFLSKYPGKNGFPHLFVLESDGSLLHSQGTAELEKGQGYDQELFQKFLAAWQPKHQ